LAEKPADDKSSKAPGAENKEVAAKPQPEADRAPASETANLKVNEVPTRVVERLVDGNYRVRGAQPFMIGSREYKVIVSGVIRSEDFNENGISSTQLLDSSFDIVSSRGSEVK
jgi:flagellar L-ring protein FlgH